MHPGKLFAASCVALVTTSMVFSIRGDIADALRADFHITAEQLGTAFQPAFLGFTLSAIFGGSLVDFFGMRRLLLVSAFGYIAAVLAIIFAPRPAGAVAPYTSDVGYQILYASMWLLGISQGLVEGVINPLAATLYPKEKTHKLSVLHAWWPGGLIIGGLAAFALTKAMGLDAPGAAAGLLTTGWQVKIGLILIPAAIYAAMVWSEEFPATERVAAGVSNADMFRECLNPMFLLWWGCMWLTASTELGPDQWVPSLITNLTGMQGVLILVYTAGLMFVLRFFGGHVAHALSPLGVLTASAALSAVGLYALGGVSTPIQAFAAATLYGVGKTFFWPLMLGVTSERFPKSGALGLALMGGTGNLAVAFTVPIMGAWYDRFGASATFRYVSVLPLVVGIVFAALYLYYKARGGYKAVELKATGR
jgi:MFS family permease